MKLKEKAARVLSRFTEDRKTWTEMAGEAARVGRRSKENRKGRTEVAGKSSKG